MIQAKSLHIGLNYVDPNHYGGWDGKLISCEKDARDMELIASSQGFATSKLIREKATRKNVINAISNVAKTLKSGDIFYVSYSGHGGRLPDQNGDEADGMDETWCLFDGQLIDDELKSLWSKFKAGVRILITSDSCHSGTVAKEFDDGRLIYDDGCIPRAMPDDLCSTTYYENQPFYDGLSRSMKAPESIKASVLLISGCQDNQYSYDGPFNGAFTGALKRVWNGGRFRGNYVLFHKKIVASLPSRQSPNLLMIGKHDSHFLEKQKPFSVA